MKAYGIVFTIFAVVGILNVAGQKGKIKDKKWNRNKIGDRLHTKESFGKGTGRWVEKTNWITTLNNKTSVTETGFISKKYKLMVVLSADDNLENSEYDKAATIVDFASDKVAIRVNLQNIPSTPNQPVSFSPNLNTNDEGDKAGSLKPAESNTVVDSNNELPKRDPRGAFGFNVGRQPGRGFRNRGRSGFRKRFRGWGLRNGRGRAFGRQRRPGFEHGAWKQIRFGKWNGHGGKQICFIIDSLVSEKEATDELKLRADGEAVLIGNEKKFSVRVENSPSKIDIKSIGPHLRRFCRLAIQTGNIFNLSKGTTTQGNGKTFRILGQIDAFQPHTSVPYGIQVDSSIDLR